MNRTLIKPTYFKASKDSAIHQAQCVGVVLINTEGQITTSGIQDYNCGDLWFHIILYNEGKSRGGKFISSGYFNSSYYNKIATKYTWHDHHYIIHENYEYYHFVCNWYEHHYFGKDQNVIAMPTASHLPLLGLGNVVKIKAAVKKYFKNL